MFNFGSCCNVSNGYEDPADEIIACKTDTRTLAKHVFLKCVVS